MNITSFTSQIVCLLQEQLGDGYHVFPRKVTKNNGVTLTGIVARRENINSFPTIYIDDYYREDIREEEMQGIALKMADRLRLADLKQPVDLSGFVDFEKAKTWLSFKLINTGKNKELLADIPNRPFFNLSVVYFYLIEKAPFEGKATVLIRKSHMEAWNITEMELYKAACMNAPQMLPPRIENMNEALGGIFPPELFEDLIPMYVLTNSEKLFGASCILYRDELKSFAVKTDSDLYILPSSVHEMILIPKRPDLNQSAFLDIVAEINHSQVPEEDVLADSVFFYNKKEDALYLLDNR